MVKDRWTATNRQTSCYMLMQIHVTDNLVSLPTIKVSFPVESVAETLFNIDDSIECEAPISIMLSLSHPTVNIVT